MKIAWKKLTVSAKMPERGSVWAAGYDLFADLTENCVLEPHETHMIGTGIAVAIPEGYFGGVFARSGLSAKEGLRPANCTGVVDADYRGESRWHFIMIAKSVVWCSRDKKLHKWL